MAMFIAAPRNQTGRKTSAAEGSAGGPPTAHPTARHAASTMNPMPMTMTVCTARASLHLADVQPADLPVGTELEAKVGLEVAPLLGVELPDDLHAVGAHAVEGGEALVADCLAGELLEAPGAAVVEELGVLLEEPGPGSPVARLERLDRGLHRGVLQGRQNHRSPCSASCVRSARAKGLARCARTSRSGTRPATRESRSSSP